MPTTYPADMLSGMSGLPEPLVRALLTTPRYAAKGDDEVVDALLALSSAVMGHLEASLVMSIVDECARAGAADMIEDTLRSLAESSRDSAEREKLVAASRQYQPQWGASPSPSSNSAAASSSPPPANAAEDFHRQQQAVQSTNPSNAAAGGGRSYASGAYGSCYTHQQPQHVNGSTYAVGGGVVHPAHIAAREAEAKRNAASSPATGTGTVRGGGGGNGASSTPPPPPLSAANVLGHASLSASGNNGLDADRQFYSAVSLAHGGEARQHSNEDEEAPLPPTPPPAEESKQTDEAAEKKEKKKSGSGWFSGWFGGSKKEDKKTEASGGETANTAPADATRTGDQQQDPEVRRSRGSPHWASNGGGSSPLSQSGAAPCVPVGGSEKGSPNTLTEGSGGSGGTTVRGHGGAAGTHHSPNYDVLAEERRRREAEEEEARNRPPPLSAEARMMFGEVDRDGPDSPAHGIVRAVQPQPSLFKDRYASADVVFERKGYQQQQGPTVGVDAFGAPPPIAPIPSVAAASSSSSSSSPFGAPTVRFDEGYSANDRRVVVLGDNGDTVVSQATVTLTPFDTPSQASVPPPPLVPTSPPTASVSNGFGMHISFGEPTVAAAVVPSNAAGTAPFANSAPLRISSIPDDVDFDAVFNNFLKSER